MIAVRNIRHSFRASDSSSFNEVLKGVTFELAPGSITGLIGPSGVGKSVLLKIMAGVLTPDSGEVRVSPTTTSGEHAEEVSLMFQEGALFDSLSVFDNIAFPLVQGRVPSMTLGPSELAEVHQRVSAILARVGLTQASQKFPAQLSGGMRRRVSLARALVCRPKILLLDDPTSGLDPIASGVIMNLICELHREYKPTTVMVSQDLRRLMPAVERVIALFDGRVVFSGTLAELIANADESVRHFVSCRFDYKHP
jgi:phospholipid/cholesterol/gamma-HCH transport system ATP-binding protein